MIVRGIKGCFSPGFWVVSDQTDCSSITPLGVWLKISSDDMDPEYSRGSIYPNNPPSTHAAVDDLCNKALFESLEEPGALQKRES